MRSQFIRECACVPIITHRLQSLRMTERVMPGLISGKVDVLSSYTDE